MSLLLIPDITSQALPHNSIHSVLLLQGGKTHFTRSTTKTNILLTAHLLTVFNEAH